MAFQSFNPALENVLAATGDGLLGTASDGHTPALSNNVLNLFNEAQLKPLGLPAIPTSLRAADGSFN